MTLSTELRHIVDAAAAHSQALDLQDRIDRLLLDDAARRIRDGAAVHQALDAAGARPGPEADRLARLLQHRHPLAFA